MWVRTSFFHDCFHKIVIFLIYVSHIWKIILPSWRALVSKYHDDSGVKRNGGYDDDIVVVAHLDGGDGDGVGITIKWW